MQQKRKYLINGCLPEIIWIVAIGVFGRLLPHFPNMTPLTGLSLFAGANLSRRLSLSIIFATLFVSDICLAFIFGYPMFGYFTLFTYTGFAMSVLVGSKLQYTKRVFPLYILGVSSGFWVWTNFGVWLTSDLYSRTLGGLGACYYMALPFLRNALIGDLVWSYFIFGIFYILLRKKIISDKGVECFFMSESGGIW